MTGNTASLNEQTVSIAGLYGQIEDRKNSGAVVSPHVEGFALHHSELANQALKDGSNYPRIAFFPIGTDRKGPSILRLLADMHQ